MGRLGQYFPDGSKQEYVDRNLKPGQVLYLYCEFTRPAKEKYLVLVYCGATPLFFVINSKISNFVQSNPHLLRCQVILGTSDYSFLQHDSFINCSEVITDFSESEIRDQILADADRVKGELNSVTRRKIIEVVRNAKTVSPRHKQLIIDSFR